MARIKKRKCWDFKDLVFPTSSGKPFPEVAAIDAINEILNKMEADGIRIKKFTDIYLKIFMILPEKSGLLI